MRLLNSTKISKYLHIMLEYLDIFKLYYTVFFDTIKNRLRIPYSRPWGQYESIIDFHENNLHNDQPGYKVKRIIVIKYLVNL